MERIQNSNWSAVLTKAKYSHIVITIGWFEKNFFGISTGAGSENLANMKKLRSAQIFFGSLQDPTGYPPRNVIRGGQIY